MSEKHGSTRGWFLTRPKGGSGWGIKFRVSKEPARWRTTRIPPVVQGGPALPADEAAARQVAEAWAHRLMAKRRELLRRQGVTLEEVETEKPAPKPAPAAGVTTVRTLGEDWTSGKLYERHGRVNGLRILKGAELDAYRLGRHVYPAKTRGADGPAFGDLPVADVTDRDVELVMAGVPKELRSGTHEKILAHLHRLFDLAEVPCRLRPSKSNPVDTRLRPEPDDDKLFSYLFPTELLALLACKTIPLGRRVLYALAVYTGLRKGSLYALTWAGVDLAQGTLFSTVSKTGVAQMFEIPADLVHVLGAWKKTLGDVAPEAPVVCRLGIPPRKLSKWEARILRADLRAAGVTRAVLFSEAENVEPLRFHDLRATFCTWAARAGKGMGWTQDRTGHVDAKMVARYTRAARTLEDLRMVPFPDLTSAIPELAPEAPLQDPGSEPCLAPCLGDEPEEANSRVSNGNRTRDNWIHNAGSRDDVGTPPSARAAESTDGDPSPMAPGAPRHAAVTGPETRQAHAATRLVNGDQAEVDGALAASLRARAATIPMVVQALLAAGRTDDAIRQLAELREIERRLAPPAPNVVSIDVAKRGAS